MFVFVLILFVIVVFVLRFDWRKDGVIIQDSLQVKVDNTKGTLSITGAQLDDYGKYQCFAINELGRAAAVEFDLKRGCMYNVIDMHSQSMHAHSYSFHVELLVGFQSYHRILRTSVNAIFCYVYQCFQMEKIEHCLVNSI